MAKVAELDDTRNWKKTEPFKDMTDEQFAEEVRRQTEFMKLVSEEAVRRGITLKNEPDGIRIVKTVTL